MRASKHKVLALIILVLACHASVAAGEIVYSLRQDGQQLSVLFKNVSDRQVIFQSFVLIFYSGEIAIERQKIVCKEDCRLYPGSVKQFGPFTIPEGTTEIRVSDIEYTTDQ